MRIKINDMDSENTKRHKATAIEKLTIAKIERSRDIKIAWANRAIPVAAICGITLIICTIIVCWAIG